MSPFFEQKLNSHLRIWYKIEYYPNASIKVFNRWGAVVHETSGGNYVAWNGTSNGSELPVGTYYYIIDLNNGDDAQTGPITIIR